jgi:translation initiation factor 2 subunit 1
MVHKYEEGEIVLCTVEKVEKTVVFVKLEEGGEGSIVTSEIAPGRIRNLREYVVPNKKIVCKILRLKDRNIELSLRRVTNKEKKDLLEFYSMENSSRKIIKAIVKEKADKIIEDIEKKEKISEFLDRVSENPNELERLVGKENAEKIIEVYNKESTKRAIIKKDIRLITDTPTGLDDIKNILDQKNIKVIYIGAGRYKIEVESDSMKDAGKIMNHSLQEIEEKAKKHHAIFSIKEK